MPQGMRETIRILSSRERTLINRELSRRAMAEQYADSRPSDPHSCVNRFQGVLKGSNFPFRNER